MKMYREALSYDDVLLVPQYSDIKSRNEVSLRSQLGHYTMELPIIASPMDTIVEVEMAAAMADLGGLAIIHRYNTIEEQVAMASETAMKVNKNSVAAAIPISGDFIERAQALMEVGVKFMCIDVAHGDHIMMRNALDCLKSKLPSNVHIMAGNVATQEGYERLVEWGADSVRVGIGGGSICSTRIQTGHGVPTLTSVIDCAKSRYAGRNPIIADGGIKTSGDIVKAIGAGADFVMIGSLFSGTTETPGNILVKDDGTKVKEYRGMASRAAQMAWRGRTSSLEGISTFVPFKGKVKYVVDDLVNGIRSGLSYTGSRNIEEFQARAHFVQQTQAGQSESSTHILKQ
jgi:IMP dehydrogenase